LQLELPLAVPGARSAWQIMTERAAALRTGPTARAIVRELMRELRPDRLWLPAYCCPELVDGAAGVPVRFYPVGAALRPEPAWLGTRLAPGDAVLAIDYFGQPPDAAFRDFARTRPEVLWIEDCAQALASGAPWGDWQIYSPRKLFGVADGGIGHCRNAAYALSDLADGKASDRLTDMAQLAPLLWRLEDEGEAQSALWHAAFRNAEAQSGTGSGPGISGLTRQLLQAIDADRAGAARLSNAAVLHRLLPSGLRFWEIPPAAPPLGYPVLLENRDTVAERLAGQGVFCPVHWRNPPSPAQEFADEHALADRLLTLPCDQRYGTAEMTAVAEALLDAL